MALHVDLGLPWEWPIGVFFAALAVVAFFFWLGRTKPPR